MGYAYHDTTARIIDAGKVYKEHDVDELQVDPCSFPQKRYTLRYKRLGLVDGNWRSTWSEVIYAWWEIIEPWDNARTRYLKWKCNKEIDEQREAISREIKKLNHMTGPPWAH